MGTGTPVAPGDTITSAKMNLKVETVADAAEEKIGSRTWDAIYHNTSSTRTIIATIAIEIFAGTEGTIDVKGYVDANTPPEVEQNRLYVDRVATGSLTQILPMTLIIPPGKYYKITFSAVGDGSAFLTHYIETLL